MNYFRLGKLVTAHGVKGELMLKHTLGKKTTLKELRAIFIEEKKDSFLPWFIESAKARSSDEIILKIEGINTREDAQKLVQKEVWIPETEFKKYAATSAPVNLLNYAIENKGQYVGRVLELIEQPHQLLCKTEMEGKEVLVPLNDSTLKKIDRKKQVIQVELPDGLLDVYLLP